MALEWMTPTGKWVEKWSEMPIDDEYYWSPFWIDLHDDYMIFNVLIDELSFIADLKYEQSIDVDAASVDLQMRIVYKTENVAIDALTQPFNLFVKGDELTSTNACAEATVNEQYVEKSGNKTLAFEQWTDEELQYVTIY
jgi:hypothetical protein